MPTRGGYDIGPTLAPGERPWPMMWEGVDDNCLHEWAAVIVQPRDDYFDEVVRCRLCHAPRCGHVHDEPPCMRRRHHDGNHIHPDHTVRPVGA